MKSNQLSTLSLIGAVTFSALYTVQAAAQTGMAIGAASAVTGSAGTATLSAPGLASDPTMAGLEGQESALLPEDDGSMSDLSLPGLGDNEESDGENQPSASESVAPVTAGINNAASEGAAAFVDTVDDTTDTVDTAAAVVDGDESPEAMAPESDGDNGNDDEAPIDGSGSVHVAGEVTGPETLSVEATLSPETQSLAVNDQEFPPAEEEGEASDSEEGLQDTDQALESDDEQQSASNASDESQLGNSEEATENNPDSVDDSPPEVASSNGEQPQSGGDNGSPSNGEEGGMTFGEAGDPIAAVTLLDGQASFELNAGEPPLTASLAGEEMSFPPEGTGEDMSEENTEEDSNGSPSLSEQVTPLTAAIDAASVQIAGGFEDGVNQTTDSVDTAAAIADGDEEDPAAIAPEGA